MKFNYYDPLIATNSPETASVMLRDCMTGRIGWEWLTEHEADTHPLNFADIESATGVSQRTLARIKSGECPVSLETNVKLMMFFNGYSKNTIVPNSYISFLQTQKEEEEKKKASLQSSVSYYKRELQEARSEIDRCEATIAQLRALLN